jgi:DNA-binding YbaB/EbfC family protein
VTPDPDPTPSDDLVPADDIEVTEADMAAGPLDGLLAEGGDDPLAALLGGGAGGAGGLDFGALMETAGQMQAQLLAAQQQAASTVVEGVAGGGAVRIAVTGGFEFQSVTIAPDAVDPDDVEMLQDLILAALRDAVDEIGSLQQPPDLGGLDLGGLLGGR